MNAKILLTLALSASLSTFACAGANDASTDDENAGATAEDLSAAGKQIAGAWSISDTDTLDSYVFHTDGTFIHDQFRVLNGVLIMGGPPPGRDIGHFTANASRKTLTLHVTQGWHDGATEHLSYEYTPARVLNGMYLPGHFPTATLVLRQLPASGSHVAYPSKTYKHRDSWCMGLPNVANNDCKIQKEERTWTPVSSGVVSCDVETNECVAMVR